MKNIILKKEKLRKPKVRKQYAPPTKVVPSKKIYDRKDSVEESDSSGYGGWGGNEAYNCGGY